MGSDDAGVLFVVVVHDLVGRLPNGDAHTADGWLSVPDGIVDDPNVSSSPVTRRLLSERGFATSVRGGPDSC